MYKDYISPELKYEIFGYVKNFHLDDDGFFTSETADYFIDNIDSDKEFFYDSGATKCIIMPKNRDYVIKIPFNGAQCDGCYNCPLCAEHPEYIEECMAASCPNLPFECAGEDHGDNYCERERELYDTIVEEYPEFQDFFLPLILAGEIKHYPIYFQEKAEILADASNEVISVSEKSRSIVSSKDAEICSAPNIWLAKCLEDLNFDLNKYNKFVNMLYELGIADDLHRSNVGYYHNHAVVIDYAGFYE